MDFRFLSHKSVRIQPIQTSQSGRAPQVRSTNVSVAATAASAGGTPVNLNDDVEPKGASRHENLREHARPPQNRTTEMADQVDQ